MPPPLRVRALASLVLLATCAPALAQPAGAPLGDALRDFAETRGLSLVYSADLVAGRRTTCPAAGRTSGRPAPAVLACLVEGTGLEARRLPSGAYALYRVSGGGAPPDRPAPPAPSGGGAVRSEAATLSGFVTDAATGEVLVGAAVYVPGAGRGASTNGYGYYSLALSVGEVRVTVSYVGYETATATVALDADVRYDVALDAVGGLGEVVVEGEAVEVEAPGSVRLTAAEVERVPALLGEADPLKALQLTPAVRFGSEGSSGLHVRGGSPDQTLLLLDGAPVYNAAHLAGAVSVFNSDALQSVRLVPGAAPARYGGRLSAVVDVAQREGSRERRTGTATVGLLASRALVEGPLAGGHGAFVVAGRRSYADLLLRPLLFASSGGDYALGYFFQDASAKANLDLDDRTRVFASVYGGQDRFYNHSSETFTSTERTEAFSTGVEWGNTTATVRATRVLSPRAFASALVYYSRYGFAAEREASDTFPPTSDRTSRAVTFEQSSGLTDVAARADVEVAATAFGLAHAVEAGAAVERRSFRPASVLRSRTVGGDEDVAEVEDRVSTVGGSAYVSDAVRLGGVRAEVGLRLGWLAVRGRAFAGLQPRLGLTSAVGPWTLRASAGRSWQPLHLLTNAGVGLPTDLWVPATDRVGPASAWQVAAEAERPLGAGWSASAGAFAKTMTGLVEYRDGAGFFASGAGWEDDVMTGSGRAVGVELAARKTGGRTEVQVAYALSRSARTFPEIDGGRTFPYRYDRTHDLSVTATRHLSPRRRLTALLVYASGAAVTVPVARTGFNTYLYGDRNRHRLPAYHRLDVSYEVDYGRGRLALGFHNMYNRLNPYYYRVRDALRPPGAGRERRVPARRALPHPPVGELPLRTVTMRHPALSLLALFVVVSGCETFVEADPEDYEPVLYVQAVFEPGVPWSVTVQRTVGLGDTVPFDEQIVTNATVTVTGNDGTVVVLPHTEQGRYGAALVYPEGESGGTPQFPYFEDGPAPEAGRTYTLRVSAPGYLAVTATSRAPRPPLDLTVRVLGGWERSENTYGAVSSVTYSNVLLGASFSPAGEDTFYEVRYVKGEVMNGLGRPAQFDVSGTFFTDAPILRESTFLDDLQGGSRRRLLSAFLDIDALDEAPDGRRSFEITGENPSVIPAGAPEPQAGVEVTAASPAYFESMRALARQEAVRANPFAEPVPNYSNVEGGAGVFAGLARARAVVRHPG